MDAISIVVLPVAKSPQPALSLPLDKVVGWFAQASLDRCRLAFETLPAVHLERNLNYYTVAGGMGRPPQNSQALAQAALESLNPAALNKLVEAQGRWLISVEAAIKPHTWHLPNGGKLVGDGVWARRYAIMPHNASLGAIAHELGHVLFDWPDLAWEKSLGEECLMAHGAWRENSHNPAPPCAPLLWQTGWRDTLPVDGDTRVCQLSAQYIGRLSWNGQQVLVERRDDQYSPRLLVYSYKGAGRMLYPKLHGRVLVSDKDNDQLLLGLIAPLLRKIP